MQSSWPRVRILGAVIMILGINLSAGILIFVVVGGAGPLRLLEVLFWGGLVMNFAGLAV